MISFGTFFSKTFTTYGNVAEIQFDLATSATNPAEDPAAKEKEGDAQFRE